MERERQTQYEWLTLRCQSGEPGAFEDLIAIFERPLLYYAASLTGSPDSGLDVLQEVWIKVLRGIGIADREEGLDQFGRQLVVADRDPPLLADGGDKPPIAGVDPQRDLELDLAQAVDVGQRGLQIDIGTDVPEGS